MDTTSWNKIKAVFAGLIICLIINTLAFCRQKSTGSLRIADDLSRAAVAKPEFAQGTVTVFDMTRLHQNDMNNPDDVNAIWDEVHAVATLQGIVNRKNPRLYILYVENDGINIDRYWWDKYRTTGKWLTNIKEESATDITSLITKFRKDINGAVVYDPQVAATSNLASTIAGAENLIAVRYDMAPNSLYSRIITNGPKLPVKIRLLADNGAPLFTGTGIVPQTDRPSNGSSKIDAYIWLIEKYLKPGKLNTCFGAYYIDQRWREKPRVAPQNHHTLTNHDFFVSKRAFFYDLSPWGDEKATDDPQQAIGADRRILEEILLLAYRQNNNGKTFTYIGGFPPWAYKYTRHAGGSHDDVPTEWEYSRTIGAYNAFKDADAIGYGALANASFWQHYPLRSRYPQQWTTPEKLKADGYLNEDGKLSLGARQLLVFYVGDYDASSWLSQTTPTIWDDPARGQVPMMWSISPVLAERVPMAWEYRRLTATPNDYFVAADNGAGYLNPGELQEPRLSGLPEATTQWAAHNLPYYEQWGLTVTGFIIDGYANGLNQKGLDAYMQFSPNGIVPQKAPHMLHKGIMPVLPSGWDINDADPKSAAEMVTERIRNSTVPFHWFRNILKSPEWYVQVAAEIKQLNPNIVLVDAPTFFELYKLFLKENPKYR
ncbi:MAG: hypothetical protein LBR06_07360 [Bacteroidales bacterium]|jgi:hypothetical protein|nr:hypothetical protein [Bacteroidales bacterium]